MNALTQHAASSAGAVVPIKTPGQQEQYLTFMLGEETFAIGILAIKEIIEYGNLTVVPMMPPAVRGVINLRGAVVPVMDLAARFGKPSTEIGKRTCIVIVEVSHDHVRHDIGVIVDAVNEVLDIAPGDIEPPPGFGARVPSDFIQGMGKVASRFIIMLNTDRVLSIDEQDLIAEQGEHAAAETH